MYDDDVQVAVDLLARGAVGVDGIVADRVPLAEVVTGGFERLARRDPDVLKVVVDCSGGAGPAPHEGRGAP